MTAAPAETEGQPRPELLAENVSHCYGNTVALSSITMSIPAHGITAIAGPSGIGKSTLAKILAGLIEPTDGNVFCNGQKVRHKQRLSGAVAWLPQHPKAALDPKLTLEQSITVATKVSRRGAAHASAVELAQHVGLDAELLTRHPGDVSGGEAQRACLARALAQNPRFLVADEPTAHLDPIAASKVADCLRTVASTGIGVALFTHDTILAGSIAQRRFVLRRDGIAS